MARGTDTRTRILETAEAAVLAKGFEATSIDEIVAAVEITRGGFFYHFADKNALARAMLERYISSEEVLFDGVFDRAGELSEDPLQRVLIGLKLLAELLGDMPNGHPGCLIAAACYQERLFDKDVQALNQKAMLAWRRRFRALFEDIGAVYPTREPVDYDALADMLSGIVEGGIVLAKALKEPEVLARQILLFRNYVKLLFQPS